MQDGDFEAIRVSIDVQVGCGYSTRRGEGVQPEDDKLSHPGSCVKAGGEAGEDGSVEGVIDVESLTEFGDKHGGVWLSFLPFG